MGTSMGQMVQMIVGLGNLQLDKKKFEQSKVEHQDQLAQAAKQLGLQEDDANFRKVTSMIGAIRDNSVKASDAIEQLASTLHLQPSQIQALKQYALTAPQTAEALRNQSAGQGYAAATPSQRDAMDTQAASVATSGQSTGQAGQAALLAQIAGAGGQQVAQNPALANTLGAGLAGNMAQPMQGITSITGANTPGLPQAAARIAAGTQMSAGQVASNSAEILRTQAELTIAQGSQQIQLAGLAKRANLDPHEVVEALKSAADVAAKAVAPTNQPATRKAYWALYNGIISHIDPTNQEGLKQQDPEAGSYGTIMSNLQKYGITGQQTPGPVAPGQMIQQLGAPQQPAFPPH